MLIDCTTCVARDIACGDCVISVLLASPPPARGGPPPESFVENGDDAAVVELDETARYALGNLAEAGLVPPLRLVAPLPSQAPDQPRTGREIA